MSPLSRRTFFKIAGLTTLAGATETLMRRDAQASQPAMTRVARSCAQPRTREGGPAHPLRSQERRDVHYTFFSADDATFMEAAVERLIPADEHGPGALQTGVPIFIDRQLSGAWGAGERLYRSGPWQPGSPAREYQLPHTPAELFRDALRGIEIDLARRPQAPPAILAGGVLTKHARFRPLVAVAYPPALHSSGITSARRDFARLPATSQDAYLKTLQAGGKDLAGIPSQVFFESLLGLTIEGFFSDPVHGGDEERVAWKVNATFLNARDRVLA